MRKKIIIYLIFLSILSCKKDNDEQMPDNPKWLNDKISMMDTSMYYKGTVVTMYKWTNEYFYLFSIPLSSCIMCDFYNYLGDKYLWSDDKLSDFQKNAIKIKIVWSEKE